MHNFDPSHYLIVKEQLFPDIEEFELKIRQ